LFRDLGIHIDGYVAVIGHTIVVGASKVLLSALATARLNN
jgi:methionine aminopeptidase